MNSYDFSKKAKEILAQKKYEVVESFVNENKTTLDLTEKLKEPYKTMYKRARVIQEDFLTNIYFWEKVNVYIYENEYEKILFFEINMRTSEKCELETIIKAYYECQGGCFVFNI